MATNFVTQKQMSRQVGKVSDDLEFLERAIRSKFQILEELEGRIEILEKKMVEGKGDSPNVRS